MVSIIRIAVIDDNGNVVRSIRDSIDWMALGCEICCTAEDGFQGREEILQERPDIVITDIMMPGFTGLELAALKEELLPDTEFIVITGYSSIELARKSIRLGVFDYIPKPFSNEELVEVVLAAAEKQRGKAASQIPFAANEVEEVLQQVEGQLGTYPALVREAIAYVNRTVCGGVTLQSTAAEMEVAAPYFSHLFKRETGQSFIRYLTMVKLREAKKLLANPRNKVYEVGLMLGYHNYSYFYQVYRRYYGHAPGFEGRERR